MRITVSIAILFFCFCSSVIAGDYEITNITPIFNDATPGFGEFKIQVGIKNKLNQKSQINVACLYVGLTRPGVYFKDEPQIMKQYKLLSIDPLKETNLTFDQAFMTYHPETLGEIIISLIGSEVVRSLPLKTRFHPKSND